MSHTVQMIDENGLFCHDKVRMALEDQWKLAGRDLRDIGLNYSLLSVLGAQSTGKSTLLNALFGTDFDTMDANIGRYQTTRGMWLAPASRDEFSDLALLVLDSEGTDSKERWEEHEAFERRTALFSLALSNILLVNMWYNEIGRYEAMNYGLLRTVFEVHLALFTSPDAQPKTLLMFLIRDWHTTPKEVLEKTVMADITHLWSEIRKPEGLEECLVTDMFDFSFETLPHKMLEPQTFDDAVTVLRERFTVPASEGYLLGDRYRKSVPADGFMAYSQGIWDTIVSNKELDLPSQREMVALFRCDAIADDAILLYEDRVTKIKSLLEQGHGVVPVPDEDESSLISGINLDVFMSENVIYDLGIQITEAINDALDAYNEQACRYQDNVARKKRVSLVNRMADGASVLAGKQMENASTWLTLSVNIWLDTARRVANDRSRWLTGMAVIGDELISGTAESLGRVAAASCGSDVEWPCEFADIVDNLHETIKGYVAQARTDHMSLMQATKASAMKLNLIAAVETAYNDVDDCPNDIMSCLWGSVRDGMATVVAKHAADMRDEMANSFRATKDELVSAESSLHVTAVTVVEHCAKESVRFLPLRTRQRFDAYFRYDRKTKLPRVWRRRDDVPTLYNDALDEAIVMIDAYAGVRLDPRQDDVSLVDEDEQEHECPPPLSIMSSNEVKSAVNKLRQDTETAYLEAVHMADTSRGASGVPLWALLLILVLGFNEFMAVLTNPVLLVLVLLLAGGLYMVHVLGFGGGLSSLFDTLVQSSLENLLASAKKWANRGGKEESAPPPRRRKAKHQ